MLLSFLLPVFAADCEEPHLAGTYSEVQVAYVQSDLRATRRAVRAFTEAAACTPPSATTVHDLHVAHALGALLDNKADEAHDHLRGAVASSPAAQLPTALRGDLRLRNAYHLAQEEPIVWKRSPPYSFDNRTWTLTPDVNRAPPVPVRNTTRSVAAVLGAVALGLYGGAWAARSTYERSKGPLAEREDVVPLHRATNGLAVGSAVAGGAAIGLFTVSLVR